MTQVQRLCRFSAFLLCFNAVQAQISTIAQFTPENVDTLAPIRSDPPDEVACVNGYCYTNGGYYRPDQPGSVWTRLVLPDPNESLYTLADVGDAVLLHTLKIAYGPFGGYNFQHRIYRTTQGPQDLQVVLEFTLTNNDAFDYNRYGQFKVLNNNQVYFSLEKYVPVSNYSYLNYYSPDQGKTWANLGLRKYNMTTACKAGNLYALFKEGADMFPNGDQPDSLYWSLSPHFTSYNATAGPKNNFFPLDMVWEQDTLYLFNAYDSLFYFTAYGGLAWASRLLPGKISLNDVAQQQGTWYFATRNGLFEASSPTAPWKPVYQYQDCFIPSVEHLYLPVDTGLPWIAGAATALLRPSDAQGSNWIDFSQGLPGYGTQSFRAMQDTLYSNYFHSADGLHWQGIRSPGLQGASRINTKNMVYFKGQLFAIAGYGDYYDTREGLYSRPDGGDWNLLDTADNQGYPFALAAGQDNLYWLNARSLRRSTDLGLHWQQVALPTTPYTYNFASKGDTLYVQTFSPNQLWRSIDQGQSWQALPIPFNSANFYFFLIGDRMVLATQNLTIWASDNGGQSWAQTNQGLPANYVTTYQVIGNILVAHLGSDQLSFYQGVMLSLDAGAHWLKLRLPFSMSSYSYYGFELFKNYFYYGHPYTGNFRFPAAPVLKKLEEITPKVPVKEPLADSGITVSPNPASSEIWLRAEPELKLPLVWQLSDTQGRRVRQGEMDQLEYRLDLAGLGIGLYWLAFPQGNFKAVPVVVQR